MEKGKSKEIEIYEAFQSSAVDVEKQFPYKVEASGKEKVVEIVDAKESRPNTSRNKQWVLDIQSKVVDASIYMQR